MKDQKKTKEQLVEELAKLRQRVAELEASEAERVRAEEDLRVKDNAVRSSLSAIAIADLEGNLNYVNPAFLAIWGYGDGDEVLGRPAVEFWQMEEKAAEVVQGLQETGQWFGELVARRKDGVAFNVQVAASIVMSEVGAPVGMMSSFVDITQRVRAEEKLKQTLAELERTNADLELFNRMAVGRELRMIELKRQVNELSEQVGKEPPYDLSILGE